MSNRIDIVIPFYNEEECLPELLSRLGKVISQHNLDAQVIFVNDGSEDSSSRIILDTLTCFKTILVNLSRNFGHQPAVCAGLAQSDGDLTIIMDADLQDEPEVIPQLLEKHSEGFDVVNVVRRKRERVSLLLHTGYRLYYKCLKLMCRTDITSDSGDFSLISRRARSSLLALSEYHAFVRGMRGWIGYRQTTLIVDRPTRFSGDSKYSIRKLFGLAFNGLLSFSSLPIRFVTLMGATISAAGLSFAVYSTVLRMISDAVPTGFTALVILVTVLSGAIIFSLGIVGEYVGRIFEQVKERPRFIVESCVELPPSGERL